MLCSYCQKRPVKAGGLCGACYSRKQRSGTLEFKRKGIFSYCSVDGCKEIAHAKKLCFTHYQRQLKHGHTNQTRPESWGEINAHPLLPQWNHLHRKAGVDLCAPEWRTDFRRFASDVGEQPSPQHRLRPRDKTLLIGPANFVWEAPDEDQRPGETRQEMYRRRERERRSANPEYFRNLDLRKKYAGLTLAGVAAMSEKQGHRCAICGDQEGTLIRGQVIALAVDHDHVTGDIRGLLCIRCNRGLGLFRDSEAFLQNAVAYLKNPPGEAVPRSMNFKRRAPRKPRVLDSQLQSGTAQNDDTPLDEEPEIRSI